ncbi:SEP domain-containing protein [Mycena epipterygia]|nr:SEP domain-containing protein [Mycena epipterygia]
MSLNDNSKLAKASGPEGEDNAPLEERVRSGPGISVQNPYRGANPDADIVSNLLKRAAENEATSAPIPDPANESAKCCLTFWRDGFTVEDGPLMRYDDPEHAKTLAAIESGFAPPTLFNVRPGQPIEIIVRKFDVNYVA